MSTTQREIDFKVPAATDFDGLSEGPRGEGFTVTSQVAPSGIELEDVQTEEMLVNMGPQHPATHGVLRVVLRTDGELVLEAVPHLGYLHLRRVEKLL